MSTPPKINYKTNNTRKNPDTLGKGTTQEQYYRQQLGQGFFKGDNVSDNLANNHFQVVDIYHIPSGRSVSFKAAITTFVDNYQAQWNRNEVYGRMDPIGTYKRTSRQITLGFSVMASSFQEAEENLRRISLLAQMHYPSMDVGNQNKPGGIKGSDNSPTMRGGPLWKLRFLNWIGNGEPGLKASTSGLMGWSDGIQFAPNLEMGVFQDGLNIYPKNYEVQFTFNVVHEKTLGWDYSERTKDAEGESIKKPINDTFPYGRTVNSDVNFPNPIGKGALERAPNSEGSVEIALQSSQGDTFSARPGSSRFDEYLASSAKQITGEGE
jgi:hypothetical protein